MQQCTYVSDFLLLDSLALNWLLCLQDRTHTSMKNITVIIMHYKLCR